MEKEKKEKEIGMIKIVKLLNEYDNYNLTDEHCDPIYDEEGNRKKANPRKYVKYKKEFEFLGKPFIQGIGVSGESAELKIISKQFGFIKRLVENDKIDFEYMEGYGRLIGYLTDNMEKPTRNKVKEGLVIMLLSIQDSPIDFLISILR